MPYSSVEDVNPSIKGIKPPVTLLQANAIARIADRLEKDGNKSAWAVAISTFKKTHTVEGDGWVRKAGSRMGEGLVGRGAGEKQQLQGPGGILSTPGVEDRVGQGQGKSRVGDGGANKCYCLTCDKEFPKKKGVPCTESKCPDCGDVLQGKKALSPIGGGVKAFKSGDKQYLVLWTSNAFEDREKEIFSTQAWKEYVKRRDDNGLKDRVWFWHVKGTDFATVAWQDMVGRILVELAEVDDTAYAGKMFHAIENPQEYGELLPAGWGTSHGYLYRASDKASGIYSFVEKFESTVLPFHRASNLYGKVREVLKMTQVASEEKSAGLAELVGEDLAQQILEEAKEASDELELAANFKEDEEEEGTKAKVSKKKKKVPPQFLKDTDEDDEDEEDEDEEEEEETKEAEEEYYELELDDTLLKEIAAHVPQGDYVTKDDLVAFKKELVSALAVSIKEIVGGTKEEVVQQALAGRLVLKPYSGSKEGKVIQESELPDREEGEKSGNGRRKDPVKAVVENLMLGGG